MSLIKQKPQFSTKHKNSTPWLNFIASISSLPFLSYIIFYTSKLSGNTQNQIKPFESHHFLFFFKCLKFQQPPNLRQNLSTRKEKRKKENLKKQQPISHNKQNNFLEQTTLNFDKWIQKISTWFSWEMKNQSFLASFLLSSSNLASIQFYKVKRNFGKLWIFECRRDSKEWLWNEDSIYRGRRREGEGWKRESSWVLTVTAGTKRVGILTEELTTNWTVSCADHTFDFVEHSSRFQLCLLAFWCA